MQNPSQSYGASPAIWDLYSVTCHLTQVNVSRLNPSQTRLFLIYLPQRVGRLSWPWCWLYNKMVYLSTYSHTSK